MNTCPETYAKQMGKPVIDWRAEIERARNGQIDEEELEVLDACSRDWVTCACGNQCAKIPRDPDGVPLDRVICNLGIKFYDNFVSGNWTIALTVLEEIESRSSAILAQLQP